MIRDPSDGSVREKREVDIGIPTSETPAPQPGITSGLPPITKNADQLARLEKAREWLKNHLHRKPVVEQGNEDEK